MLTLATNLDRSIVVDKNRNSQDSKDESAKAIKEDKKENKEENKDTVIINKNNDDKNKNVVPISVIHDEEIKINDLEIKSSNIDHIVHGANLVLKSLLKKSSSNKGLDVKVKHNRNVTFNQTVIVFCEELETESPSDLFEPPLGYQDTILKLQKEFSDKQKLDENEIDDGDDDDDDEDDDLINIDFNNNKIPSISSLIKNNDEKEVVNLLEDDLTKTKTSNNNNKVSKSFMEKIERLNRICSANENVISNLIDETSPDKTKISFDDLDSELEEDDDYLIKKHMNSNQSYLCNDAVSDYDSDSESSTCFERTTIINNDRIVKSNSGVNNETIKINLSKSNKSTSARVKVSTINNNGQNKKHTLDNSKLINKPVLVDQKLDTNNKISSNNSIINNNNNSSIIIGNNYNNIKNSMNAQSQRNNINLLDQSIAQLIKHPNGDTQLIIESDERKQNIFPIPVSVANKNTNNSQNNTELKYRQARDSLANQIRKELSENNTDATETTKTATTTVMNLEKRNSPINSNLSQQPQQQSNLTNIIQTQAIRTNQNNQQATACHICRVIETSNMRNLQNISVVNRNSLIAKMNEPEVKQLVSSSETQQQNIKIEQQLHPNVTINSSLLNNNNNKNISFDQSCSSCREVLARKQNSNLQNLTQITNNNQAQQQQPFNIRPNQQTSNQQSYQLIHILDQKGNCIKTLSVVRPPAQNISANQNQITTAQLNPGTRVFIAHPNGIRVPQNIGTIVGQQTVNSNSSSNININSNNNNNNNNLQRPNSLHLINNNNNNSTNPTQFKVVNVLSTNEQHSKQPIILNASKNILVQAALSNNNSTLSQQTSNNISDNRNSINFNNNNSNLKQHTVYYVRQPLNTHIVSQSIDQLSSKNNSSSSKSSFPDAQEIRRLDGLKGPSIISNQQPQSIRTNNSIQQNIDKLKLSQFNQLNSHRDDEKDDPTFGFSNRPKVKVVAVKGKIMNSNNNENQGVFFSKSGIQIKQNPNSTIDNKARETNINIAQQQSLFSSQTLDRRQQQQQRVYPIKTTIPGTSSMSNIHNETFDSLQGKANFNSKLNQQQQPSPQEMTKIPPKKDFNQSNNFKPKGMLSNSFHRWLTNKIPL